jgi:hypothetical protein
MSTGFWFALLLGAAIGFALGFIVAPRLIERRRRHW